MLYGSLCHLVFSGTRVLITISTSIYTWTAEGNSTHDRNLIKSLITATSISLLIFQRKYLLPYISPLKVYSLAFLRSQRSILEVISLLHYPKRKQNANISILSPNLCANRIHRGKNRQSTISVITGDYSAPPGPLQAGSVLGTR